MRRVIAAGISALALAGIVHGIECETETDFTYSEEVAVDQTHHAEGFLAIPVTRVGELLVESIDPDEQRLPPNDFTFDPIGRAFVAAANGEVIVYNADMTLNNVLDLAVGDNLPGFRFATNGGLLSIELYRNNPEYIETSIHEIEQDRGQIERPYLNGPKFNLSTPGHDYIYCLYTAEQGVADGSTNGEEAQFIRIARVPLKLENGVVIIDGADENGFRTILGHDRLHAPPAVHDHKGAAMRFARDGSLIVSTGDSGVTSRYDHGVAADFDTCLFDDMRFSMSQNVGAYRAQLKSSLAGKLLRIDPDSGIGYSNNPFYGDSSNYSGEERANVRRVYALGLRQPFNIALRPGSTSPFAGAPNVEDVLIHDVGFVNWEEINLAKAPAPGNQASISNFGWPYFEGQCEEHTYTGYTEGDCQGRCECAHHGGHGRHYECDDTFNWPCQNATQFCADFVASNSYPIRNPYRGVQNYPGLRPLLNLDPRNPAAGLGTIRKPLLAWYHYPGLTTDGCYSSIDHCSLPGVNERAASPIASNLAPVYGNGNFFGSASIAGAFTSSSTGSSGYPAAYAGRYFFADYSGETTGGFWRNAGWIRTMALDSQGNPTAVHDLIDDAGFVIDVERHPVSGEIYYLRHSSAADVALTDPRIVRIAYTGTNHPPVASFTASPGSSPSAPAVVHFDGSLSHPGEGDQEQLNFHWDFGDGSWATGEAVTHSYAATGVYRVCLTVTEVGVPGGALSSTVCGDVVVGNSSPRARIVDEYGDTYPFISYYYCPTGNPATCAQPDIVLHPGECDPDGNSGLSHRWKVTDYHNTHNHGTRTVNCSPGVPCTGPLSFGAFSEFLHGTTHKVTLEVTDAPSDPALSLSAEDYVYLTSATEIPSYVHIADGFGTATCDMFNDLKTRLPESLARRPEGVEVDGFILNLARIADANTKIALSIDPNERFRDAWYSIEIEDAGTRVELDWYHGVDREPFLPHGGCNPPADGLGGSISVYTGSCENLVDLQLMKALKIPEAERGTLYYVTTSDNERLFIRCAAYESCLYRSNLNVKVRDCGVATTLLELDSPTQVDFRQGTYVCRYPIRLEAKEIEEIGPRGDGEEAGRVLPPIGQLRYTYVNSYTYAIEIPTIGDPSDTIVLTVTGLASPLRCSGVAAEWSLSCDPDSFTPGLTTTVPGSSAGQYVYLRVKGEAVSTFTVNWTVMD